MLAKEKHSSLMVCHVFGEKNAFLYKIDTLGLTYKTCYSGK